VPIILRTRPVHWVSRRPCTTYSATAGLVLSQRWLALKVRAPLIILGEGGEIEGLVPIILRARPVHWVSLKSYTAYSATAGLVLSQRWLALEVRAPLMPLKILTQE